MKSDVLLGLQWGDEGKGKIVDAISGEYDIIARFQGGPNAGHSLCFDGQSYILHTVPSGIFHDDTINIIGNGVVLDPAVFRDEISKIRTVVKNVEEKIFISRKAHLIIPTHRLLDKASEDAKGKTKIGSTLRGIGPAYMDKTGRNGLRVGDIESPDFTAKYKRLKEMHMQILSQFDGEYNPAAYETDWFEGLEILKRFRFVNSEYLMNEYVDSDKAILAEGAQGTLLDIEFGTYPYVTSSNTVCAGACTGLGMPPTKIGNVKGIFKAYCTRVGSGPFYTELKDNDGQRLRDEGNEYGSTTGRPRRCGWLDLVALKYAVMLNGINQLIMTKADVLNDFESIKVAVQYKVNGKETDQFPFDTEDETEIVYEELPGWKTSLNGIKDYDRLPENLKSYIAFIEEYTGVNITIISTGPDREETIYRQELSEE